MIQSDEYPSYIPLIFALKDLCIRFYPDKADSPEAFSMSACLMRGETSLPMVDDAVVEAHLKNGPHSQPPPNPMGEIMRQQEFSEWPDDAFIAVLGIFAFGPGDTETAIACALHSLQLNKQCTLARQLLQLLSEEIDPRVPFSDIDTETEDALVKITGGLSKEQRGRRIEAANQLFVQGWEAFESGHMREAKEHFERARDGFSSLSLEKEAADSDLSIGDTLRALDRPQQALEHFERARDVYLHLRLGKDVADSELKLGNALNALGQPQQAIKHHERARAAFSNLSLEEDVAGCDYNIGNALNNLGQPQRAKEHYERARDVFASLDSERNIADCDFGIGATLRALSRPQQAIEHYKRARAVFFDLGLKKDVTDCDFNIGVALSALGRPQQAIEHYERARDVFSSLSLQGEIADCDFNIGNNLLTLGRPKQAIEHFERARDIFSSLGFKKDVADCDLGIGIALGTLGQPQQALGYFGRARAIYSDLGFEKQVADSDSSIGNALGDLGRPHQAIEHFERARDVYFRLGFDEKIAFCDYNTGYALTLAAVVDPTTAHLKYQQALKYLDNAILILEKLRTEISVADYRISFFEQFTIIYRTAIRCCLHLGQISEALHYLERSRSKVLAEAVSGNLIPDRNEVGEKLYAEFLNLRARLRQEGLLPMVKSDFNAKPESDDSGSTRRQAQHEFDTLVQRIAREFPKSAFTRKLAATEVRYLKEVDEYVDLLPDNRSCLLEFLAWADDGRLRAFLVTKQKKLELIVFPEGSLERLAGIWQQWKRMYVDIATLTEIEGMSIIWQTCHQLHELIFAAEIEVVRQSGGAGAAMDTERRRLLDYLNTTLEQGDEKQPRRMDLIPHAQLFFMPLHAACWSEQSAKEMDGAKQQETSRPHYLIEDYLCIYAPSAYLLKVSQERQYAEPEEPRAIVVGNPKPIPKRMELPGAKDEAEDAAKLLAKEGWKVDSLIEEGATKQRYLNGDGRGVAGINKGVYHHQHLALHGSFGENGKQAGLRFGDSSEGSICSASDIAGAPLQTTRSVIAAACYSSATDLSEQSTNEYLGMAAAFLQAGVGTFVGTLYPLSDAGSRWLVPELYRLHLQQGLSWADALRRAQLAGVMASGTSRNKRGLGAAGHLAQLEKEIEAATNQNPDLELSLLSHPYHWAAFTISGKE